MKDDPILETGFTPIIDVVADELGLIPAAVYGVVRRFCQLRKGVCDASLETLSQKLGVNKVTIMRHLKTLCENGYLEDLTPARRNAVHAYRDIGMTKIIALLDNKTVAESNSLGSENSQTVAESNATVAESNATVAESHLKILDTKEETIQGQDYLDMILTQTDQEKSEPSDFEKYFGYRDKFLEIYNLQTGQVCSVPAIRHKIISIAQQEGADPDIWEKSIMNTIGNWSGHSRLPPIDRIIEVYEAGGDYQRWYEQKYGQNGHSPKSEKVILK